MIRKRRSAFLAILAAALLAPVGIAGSAGAVSGAEVETPIDEKATIAEYAKEPGFVERIAAIQEGVNIGHLSQADQEWLADRPGANLLVVDPAATTDGTLTQPLTLTYQNPGPLATTCRATDRYSNWYSIPPRALVYRYHTRANFCFTGTSVSVSNNYGYFSDVSSIYAVVNANLVNSVNPVGSSKQVHTQGQISQCIIQPNIGCQNFYPWGRVTISPTGNVSFTSGE